MTDPRIDIRPALLFALNADVRALYALMEYRPTVAAIFENARREFLLVKSPKADYWSFLQGGVERDEDIITALVREVYLEVGVQISEVLKFCYGDRRDFPLRGRDGFTSGKRYYYFYARCEGSPTFTLQTDEVAAAEWVSPMEVLERIESLKEQYPDKHNSMLTAWRRFAHS